MVVDESPELDMLSPSSSESPSPSSPSALLSPISLSSNSSVINLLSLPSFPNAGAKSGAVTSLPLLDIFLFTTPFCGYFCVYQLIIPV